MNAWKACGDAPEYFGELKFDGLALSLLYENGVLVRAATLRGWNDRRERHTKRAHDISRAATASNIEERNISAFMSRIEVRGEVVMTKNIDEINAAQRAKGEKEYANTRNLAAGSLRQLDQSTASRARFLCVRSCGGNSTHTHEEEHSTFFARFYRPYCAITRGTDVENIYRNRKEKKS